MTGPTFVSIGEVVAHLYKEHGASPHPATIRRWAVGGKVRSRRVKSSGYYLICLEDIDDLLSPEPVSA